MRALLEGAWFKTRDRAALQLQALLDQWADGDGLDPSSPQTAHRLQHVFGEDPSLVIVGFYLLISFLSLLSAAPMPSRAVLQLETARAYLRVGAVSSAAELFERLGRTKDRIQCLVASGRSQAAGQLVRDLLVEAEGGERWELLCLQGDLDQQPLLWQQAWQESNGACPLAMRLAGRRSLALSDWEQAQHQLFLALQVNSAHPEAQVPLLSPPCFSLFSFLTCH